MHSSEYCLHSAILSQSVGLPPQLASVDQEIHPSLYCIRLGTVSVGFIIIFSGFNWRPDAKARLQYTNGLVVSEPHLKMCLVFYLGLFTVFDIARFLNHLA